MESLKKMLFSIMTASFFLILSGCNYGIFDWNKQNIHKTRSYKQTVICNRAQQDIARDKLGSTFNDDVDTHVLNMCIKNHKYKFESDPKYKFESDPKYKFESDPKYKFESDPKYKQ